MEIIDNINQLLGDSLKLTITPGAKLKIAASCFSIYAFEALKAELEKIESLQFIFTFPTFVQGEATDFVAETKGSMSSMELREIEKSKINCARKFFAKITSDQVRYEMVTSYGKLMEVVK